jgi:CheY-like chemotaxis protein
MPGAELLRKLHAEYGPATPPVIVYTGRELSRAQETELRRVAEAIVIKDAQSPERLLEETSLFLHRAPAQMPEPKRRMLEKARHSDPLLVGRKVLVVDDDVRNIFALNTVLERYGMKVAFAESAKEGISLLEREADVELVLMDVMMPEMDGYQAMRAIRGMERLAHLPILALTAKAMKGDREKCLEAGASDYITKPVDIDKLLSLLRVWLHAPRGQAPRAPRKEIAE